MSGKRNFDETKLMISNTSLSQKKELGIRLNQYAKREKGIDLINDGSLSGKMVQLLKYLEIELPTAQDMANINAQGSSNEPPKKKRRI